MFSEVLAFLCTQPPLRIRLRKIQTVPFTACADSPRSSPPASPSESATSDSPNRPGFGTFRRFPALAFGPSQRSSYFQTSAPSGDSSGPLLPSRRTSAPSATTSGRPPPLHSRVTASAFSVRASAPSGSGNRKGREDGGEVGQGRGNGEGKRPSSRHLTLRVGKGEEKKGRPCEGPKKAARDKSSQRGKGCARPLRRLPARLRAPAQGERGGGGEMGFCACVNVGLSRGFSAAPEGPPPTPASRSVSARARVFPFSPGEGTAFPTVRLGRPLY